MRAHSIIITVMTSLVALEINNQNGIIPARTSQKITATAYPSRRVCYKFKLSYELFSMFGMLLTIHDYIAFRKYAFEPPHTCQPEAKKNCKEVAFV